MSDIVILRAALDALNGSDNQTGNTRTASTGRGLRAAQPQSEDLTSGSSRTSTAAPANHGLSRAGLVPEILDAHPDPLGALADHDFYFEDELDSESVRLLALKAQQQLSIQALAIANVRALSIIGLFRDDEPSIRLM